MFCEECGAQMSLRAKFCRTCGVKTHETRRGTDPDVTQSVNDTSADSPELPDENNRLKEAIDVSDGLRRDGFTGPEPKAKPATAHGAAVSNVTAAQKVSLYDQSFSIYEWGQSIWGLICLVLLGAGLLTAWVQTRTPSPENAIFATAEAEALLAAAEADRLAEAERAARVDSEEVLAAFETAKASRQISKLGAFHQDYPNSQNRDEAKRLAGISLRRQNSDGAMRVYQRYFGELPQDMKTVSSGESRQEKETSPDVSHTEFLDIARLHREAADQKDEDENLVTQIAYVGPKDMDGEPHGIGKMRFENNVIYEGRFEHGERTIGKTTFADGSYYTGGYRGAYPHGQGIQVEADGSIYSGMFQNGDITGQGKLEMTDGSVYSGGFLDSEFHGQGTLSLGDGNKITGSFVDGHVSGKARQDFDDGSYYIGSFKSSEFHGQGKFVDVSGYRYGGEFRNGKRDGTAKVVTEEGTVYRGECRAGKAEGQASYDNPAIEGILYGTFESGFMTSSICKSRETGAEIGCEYEVTFSC